MVGTPLSLEQQREILEKEIKKNELFLDRAEAAMFQEHPEASRLFLAIRDYYKNIGRLSFELGQVESRLAIAEVKRENEHNRPNEPEQVAQWSGNAGRVVEASVEPEVDAAQGRHHDDNDLDWLRETKNERTLAEIEQSRERADDIDWLRDDLERENDEGPERERDRERYR